MRVNHSDIDGNQHCNMMVYIRFCHDAGALAVHKGRLKGFVNNLYDYRVKRIYIRYVRETLVNDELCVKGWEDMDNCGQLNFIIYRGEHIVTECSMAFYPRLNSKL